MKVTRLSGNPIIFPNMDERMGTNINGPSLIRVPEWLPKPLGRYYLYFAHHQGKYIRMAYADHLEGPWRTHGLGTLQLEQSYFQNHIASPDVHVDNERQQIRMYYHGCCQPQQPTQATRVAISSDGLAFSALPEVLGSSYWRVFSWQGFHYALAMPGQLYRSKTGLTDFEAGPNVFPPGEFHARHSAVLLQGTTLRIFFSRINDCPERILCASMKLDGDWHCWQPSEPVTVLEPEMEYEGSNLPLAPSIRGWAPQPVRQLRDPAVFREGDKTYLLYSVAGESGIAIAAVTYG